MSKKRFDPDSALDRAMGAFWASGYDGTSAQDLVEAMGINRGSLYSTFGSKRQLYERALERYLDRDRATLAAGLEAKPTLVESLAALLRRYADELVGDPDRRGCFLVNACADLRPDDTDVAGRLESELRAQQAILEQAIDHAKALGELDHDRDSAAIAAFLVATIQGLRVVGKATSDRAQLETIIQTTLAAVGQSAP